MRQMIPILLAGVVSLATASQAATCSITAADYTNPEAGTVRIVVTEDRAPYLFHADRHGSEPALHRVQALNCREADKCMAAGEDYFSTAGDGGDWWGDPASVAPSWLSFEGERYNRRCLPG